MKYSLGISNFLEGSSNLSHSVVFLYFFALFAEEGFLFSPCFFWNSAFRYFYVFFFFFSFAFSFSSENTKHNLWIYDTTVWKMQCKQCDSLVIKWRGSVKLNELPHMRWNTDITSIYNYYSRTENPNWLWIGSTLRIRVPQSSLCFTYATSLLVSLKLLLKVDTRIYEWVDLTI